MEKRNLANYMEQLNDQDAGIRELAVEYIRRYIEYNIDAVKDSDVASKLTYLLLNDKDKLVRSAVSFALVQLATYDPDQLVVLPKSLNRIARSTQLEKDENTRSNSFLTLRTIAEHNPTAFKGTDVIDILLEIRQKASTVRDRFRANRILHIIYTDDGGKRILAKKVQSRLGDDPDRIRVFCDENNWQDLMQFIS
ncbi:MAG: hypothetical protein ACTSW4_04015 [Candidatus Ranarchaeia archaeon]